MNDVNMSQQDLINLINLAKAQKIEAPIIPTAIIFNKYKDTHKLSSYTVTFYDYVFTRLSEKFYNFPTEAIQIDEYIANFKTLDNKELSFTTRNNHLIIIKSVIKFAVKTFNIPDYLGKISKIPRHQVETDHITKSPEELIILINNCKKPLHRLIVLTLIDSGCRIGELGFTDEHPGLTTDRIFPDLEEIHIYGKTGFHKMHCSAELCEALIQNASPSGAVFHTHQNPAGMTAHHLTSLVRWLFLKTFPKTAKMGAHTIRHSVGTIIADQTGQPLAVKEFLRHAKIDMSMNYIHETERRKNKKLSPLKIIGNQNIPHRQTQIKPSLLTDGEESTSTALTIVGEETPIEHVEGTVDISESMFNQVPENYEARPRITTKDLKIFRALGVFYAKQAPQLDPLPGEAARLYNRIIQRSNNPK